MVGNNFESDASELYRRGRELMDENQLEEATVLFDQSAKVSPHFKTLELLGECLFRLGRPNDAIIPLAAAVALNKGVRAASILSETFLFLDDYDQANQMAEIALSRDPTNRKALQVKNTAADYITSRNK